MRERGRRRFWLRRAAGDHAYANFYAEFYDIDGDRRTRDRAPSAGGGAEARGGGARLARLLRTVLVPVAGVVVGGGVVTAVISGLATGAGTEHAPIPGSASTSVEPAIVDGIAGPKSRAKVARSATAGTAAPGSGIGGTRAVDPARPARSSASRPGPVGGGDAPAPSTRTSRTTASTPPRTPTPSPTTPAHTPTPTTTPTPTCLIPNPLEPGTCLVPEAP